MDPLSLISSIASIILIGALAVRSGAEIYQTAANAQTELDTLVAEVESTRAALGPLERYVRLESMDQHSRKVVLRMMADLEALEDQLFTEIENILGGTDLSEIARWRWTFRRNKLQEIARRISTQKITILALQVAELTHQSVILAQNTTSQERALTEFLQTNPIPNPVIPEHISDQTNGIVGNRVAPQAEVEDELYSEN